MKFLTILLIFSGFSNLYSQSYSKEWHWQETEEALQTSYSNIFQISGDNFYCRTKFASYKTPYGFSIIDTKTDNVKNIYINKENTELVMGMYGSDNTLNYYTIKSLNDSCSIKFHRIDESKNDSLLSKKLISISSKWTSFVAGKTYTEYFDLISMNYLVRIKPFILTRYSSNGDSIFQKQIHSFDPDIHSCNSIKSVTEMPDGKIVMLVDVNSVERECRTVHILTFDADYNLLKQRIIEPEGIRVDLIPYDMFILNDNNILVNLYEYKKNGEWEKKWYLKYSLDQDSIIWKGATYTTAPSSGISCCVEDNNNIAHIFWSEGTSSSSTYNYRQINSNGTIIKEVNNLDYRIFAAMKDKEGNVYVSGGYKDDSETKTGSFVRKLDAASGILTDLNSIGMKLYPNPASNIINFDVEDACEFEITNIQGAALNCAKLSEKNKIDISSLPQGNYLLKIKTIQGKIYSAIFSVMR